MERKELKPCPFCGVELKPFISTHEVTTVDGKKIGEYCQGFWETLVVFLRPPWYHRAYHGNLHKGWMSDGPVSVEMLCL